MDEMRMKDYPAWCLVKEQLWKESLNSDGQQFHQNQQNERLPLTSNHWT